MKTSFEIWQYSKILMVPNVISSWAESKPSVSVNLSMSKNDLFGHDFHIATLPFTFIGSQTMGIHSSIDNVSIFFRNFLSKRFEIFLSKLSFILFFVVHKDHPIFLYILDTISNLCFRCDNFPFCFSLRFIILSSKCKSKLFVIFVIISIWNCLSKVSSDLQEFIDAFSIGSQCDNDANQIRSRASAAVKW